MDYGDRQDRAEYMVKRFRLNPSKVFPHPSRDYTGEEIASEIEQMTELGRNLVAVGGFVLQALNATPEFFAKRGKHQH